jgi:hypothetical protein
MLTVPIFVYLLKMDVQPAIATSLAVVAVISLAGTVFHYRHGRIKVKVGMAFGSAAMVGAYGGGWAAHFVPGRTLMILFALMLGATAVSMLRGGEIGAAPTHEIACGGTHCLRMGLVGFAVGSVTGLIGTGGGFVIVPALVLAGGISIKDAIGTSLFIITLNALAGFAGHLSHVSIDWRLAAAFSALAVGGSFLGVSAVSVVSAERLRRSFAYFVLVMAVFIFTTNVS